MPSDKSEMQKNQENGGHFVFRDLQGQGSKIENVIQQIRIQHTQIRVNQVYDCFYYEML